MSTALRRKLIALVSAAALCVAVPGAALAGQGGVPHSTKPCKSKVHGNGPKKDDPQPSKGKSCGFKKHN